jgi:hypothetical protein
MALVWEKGVIIMTKKVLVLLTLCFAFTLLLASPTLAAKCNGNGFCDPGEKATCADCGGGGGGGNEDTPVCIVFREAAGLDLDQVRSDDPGVQYCDSDDGVTAVIGGFAGRLILNTEGKSPTRQMIVNFPGCDSPDDFPLITVDGEGNCLTPGGLFLRSRYVEGDLPGGATGGDPDLLGMETDSNASERMDFQISFPSHISKSTPNLIVYGGSTTGPCGHPLSVIRMDLDTWVITNPYDPAIQEACLFEVISKNNKRAFLEAPFDLPFEIEITRE